MALGVKNEGGKKSEFIIYLLSVYFLISFIRKSTELVVNELKCFELEYGWVIEDCGYILGVLMELEDDVNGLLHYVGNYLRLCAGICK